MSEQHRWFDEHRFILATIAKTINVPKDDEKNIYNLGAISCRFLMWNDLDLADKVFVLDSLGIVTKQQYQLVKDNFILELNNYSKYWNEIIEVIDEYLKQASKEEILYYGKMYKPNNPETFSVGTITEDQKMSLWLDVVSNDEVCYDTYKAKVALSLLKQSDKE